jgi:hypothetical protein
MECDEVREELGAYALRALEPEERWAIEEHLRRCPLCREEAGAYEDAAGALALSVPVTSAAARLRSRVLAALPAASQDVAEARARRRWLAPAAGIAAAAVIAALVAWATVLQLRVNDLDDEQRALSAAAARSDASRLEDAMYLLTKGDLRYMDMVATGAATGTSSSYAWSPSERQGVLWVRDLPAPPEGTVYQFWFRTDQGDVSGGTFSPDAEGEALEVVQREGGNSSGGQQSRLLAILVTVEPAGGSSAATGPLVLQGQPAN